MADKLVQLGEQARRHQAFRQLLAQREQGAPRTRVARLDGPRLHEARDRVAPARRGKATREHLGARRCSYFGYTYYGNSNYGYTCYGAAYLRGIVEAAIGVRVRVRVRVGVRVRVRVTCAASSKKRLLG